MNKTELIAAVAEKAELSKKDAEKAVNALLDTVVEEVAKGEKIQLVGFGTFERRERKREKAAIHRQARRYRFLHLWFQHSRLARHSRTLSTSNLKFNSENPTTQWQSDFFFMEG